MEFTLRQARNLESRLRNLSIENQIISVRAYDSEVALMDIDSGIMSLEDDIDTKVRTNRIRHTIKHMINVSNMECGVSELLNSRDSLYSERDLLSTIGESDDKERQLSYIKDNPTSSHMACVVSKDIESYVENRISEIDIELRNISHELNILNSSVTIDLYEDYSIFLQANGFI